MYAYCALVHFFLIVSLLFSSIILMGDHCGLKVFIKKPSKHESLLYKVHTSKNPRHGWYLFLAFLAIPLSLFFLLALVVTSAGAKTNVQFSILFWVHHVLYFLEKINSVGVTGLCHWPKLLISTVSKSLKANLIFN